MLKFWVHRNRCSPYSQKGHDLLQKISMQEHDRRVNTALGVLQVLGAGRRERGLGLLLHSRDLGGSRSLEQESARQSREGSFLRFSLERPGPRNSLLSQGPPSAGPRPPERGDEREVNRFRRQGGGGNCTGQPQQSQTSSPFWSALLGPPDLRQPCFLPHGWGRPTLCKPPYPDPVI